MAIPAIPIHAQPAYLPGVHVGDSVTFGQVGGTLAPFSDTKSIVETVTNVNGATVEISQIYNLKNGTSLTMIGTVNVQTGVGSSSVFNIAGGLGAGDSLYQSGSSATSFFGIGFITETVSRVYAGALRSVNAIVVHTTQFGQTFDFAFYWDVSTGLLLDASVQFLSISGQSAQEVTVNIKVTSTNIWGSSVTPDFGFDAILHGSPLVYQGQSASYTLNLTSFQNFSGLVTLSSSLTNSSLSYHPALTLGAPSVNVPSSGFASTTLALSTDASTPLGLYLFSVHALSGGSSHDDLFAVSVRPPSFELVSTPPNLTMAGGSTAASTITIKALGVFSGSIGLSSFPGNPSITTSLSKTTVSLSSSVSSANSTLNVSVGTFGIPGDYSVYVTGTSGQSQSSLVIPVTIMGPQFRMSVNASSLTITPGRSTAVAVTLTSVSGFSGIVGLTDSSYGPAAISLSQTSIVLSSGASATATIMISVAPSASPGSFVSVTVTGVSGLLQQTQSVFVTVPGSSFLVSASPSSLTIQPGQNGNFTIFLTSNGGFSGQVALAAQFYGSPLGYVFSSTNLTLTAGGTAVSTLEVSAPATVPQGSSSINLYANSGNLSQQAFLSVNIGAPPILTPDFGISAFPSILFLAPGTSGNSTITLNSLNGFKGNLTVSALLQGAPPSICPGPSCPTISLTQTVLRLSSAGSNSTTLSVAIPATTPHPSGYLVRVTATNGSLFHDASVEVGSCPCPYFQASFNTNSVTILQGMTVAPMLILSSFQGFSGSVSLHLFEYGPNCVNSSEGFVFGPSCPAISLSPTSVPLSANGTATSTLSIVTNSTTNVDQTYNVQVVANSTSQTNYAFLNVNVVRLATSDFTVSSAPSPLIVTPGRSAPMSILLTSLNGFSGKVTLSSSLGQSVAVSPNQLNLTVASGGFAATTLTISAQPDAPRGYSNVFLTGTSGTLTRGFYLPIIVAAPDFSTVASLTSLTVQAGGKSNSTTITIPSLDGLQGTVTLKSLVQPCFNGICPSVSFSPPSVNLSQGGWASSNVSISASLGTPPGSYFIIVNATNGVLSHPVYLSVEVSAPISFFPDYGIFASPSALSIAQGGSENSTITLNSLNGFSGAITLSDAAPPGITAALVPSSVSVTPGGTKFATLSVSIASTTATGFYSVIVIGTNGTASHSVDISLQVVGPDFTISAKPDFLTVQQGKSGVSTITLNSLAGFAGTVTLSASGDLSTSFSTSTVLISPGGSASSNFTINAFAPTPGVHYLTVTAFAGTVSHAITITVDLTGPDFSIFAIPSRLTIAEGASALSTITLTGLDGFSSPILLTTFSPYGLQSSVGPADVTLSSTVNLVTAGLNVTVPATLVPGSFYYVAVTATNGILSHSVNVPVVVTGPDFTISADPTFLTIEQGKNATSTISLSSLDGFQGTVELSANSFGAISMSLNSTVTLSPGGTGTATLSVSTTKLTTLGGYTFFVTGTSGILSHYTDVFVTVAGPDFRISANPNSFILMAGQKVNSTISLSSIDNFAGIVKLSISANGVIASLNPVSVTLTSTTTSATSNLTITVPAALTPGIYGIGVTGVNGSLSHTIIISVEVIGPDFTIVSNPAFPSPLKAGQTTLFTITLRSLLDFSGLVTLTISSPILSASLSSTDINLAPGGRASADLNITVPANTVPGSYTITVTGVSGLLSHTTYIFVGVIGPDFSVGVVPFTETLLAGTTGTVSVLLESLNGFSGTVNLSTTSPNGFTTTLNSGKITLPSGGLVSDSLAISVPANTLTGTYRVDVTATNASGVPVHSTFVQLYVLAQNFTLITFPSTISIQAGSIGKSIVDVVGLNGFSGTVALTVSYNTQQLSASLGSASLKLTPGFTNTTDLTISTTTGTSPGVYQVVVNGTVGSLLRSVTVNVYVTAPTNIQPTSTTLTCSTPVKVNQASSCTATVASTTSGATTPSGSISFATNSTGTFSPLIASCNLGASAVTGTAGCSFSYAPGVAGNHLITVTYSGDSAHTTSSGSFKITATLGLAPTTIAVSCSPSSVQVGSPTTCTATVTDTSASPTTPTGAISFGTDSSGTFSSSGNCILSPGTIASTATCNLDYSPSAVGSGTHAITANYSGDSTHGTSLGTTAITVTTSVGGSVVANVTVGSGPWGVVYDSGNGYVYVTDLNSNSVSVINGTTVLTTIPVGDHPAGAGYDSRNGYVYVTNSNSNTVSVINGTTNMVVATVSVGIGPVGVVYNSGNGYIYVTNDNSNTVSVINGTIVVAEVQVGHGTTGVAYDNINGYVYAATGDANGVSVINGTTVVATIPVGSISYGVVYDGGNGYVYVTNSNSNTVSVINGTTVVATIPVGSIPYFVAYDSGNGYIYVTNSGSNSASVINGTTVLTTVQVGNNPFGVGYDSGNGFVYVANFGSDTVSVISTAATAAFQYSLSNDGPLSIQTGSSGSVLITATLAAGTARSVTLSCSGLPTGIACVFNSNTNPVIPTGSSSLTINVSSSVAPGSYSFQVTGSPLGANPSSATTTVNVTVTAKATPTIRSTVTPSSITIGGSAPDLATLTGGTSPTGTVTYTAYSDSACTVSVFTSANIPLGSPSGAFTPTVAGTYFFIASYNGDANNNAVSTTCGATSESLTVSKATPTISSTVTPASVPLLGSASDQATVSGGFDPSGTVTYSVYSDSACTAGFLNAGAVPLGTPSFAFNPAEPAGTYFWIASYNGDANNNAVSTVCGATGETLTVTKATPTITSTVSPSSITIGDSASDAATLFGTLNLIPSGTVTYTAYSDSACTVLVFTSANIPLGNPSDAFTPTTAGTYLWIASYGGDKNFNAVASSCDAPGETLTVTTKATPAITSLVTPATIVISGSASDLATLTGGSSPTGTVTYTAYTDPFCISNVAFTDTEPVGIASKSFTPSAAGTYYWIATYNGNVNNNAASTICGASGETLAVVTAPDFALTPTSTTVTFAANSLASDKLRVGAMNGFTGAVSFLRVGSPFGGVSYSCSSVTLSLTIVSANSTCTFSSNTPGTYTAIVNGTGGTPPVFHLVTYTVVVVKNTPSIHTALSASTITVGESVTDSATLTGTDLLTASGTVTYQFFSGSSCVGTATAVGTPVVVNSGVIPTSISQTSNSAGSYSWNAVYSGDANNSGATSPCELLTVNKASPTLVTLLSSTSITVGNTVSDSATVTGGFQASGTVAYSVFTNNICTAPGKIVSTVAITEGVVPNSRLVTFNSTGDFGFQASYGGDANNNGATSPCEPLSVTTAGQPVLLTFKGFDLDDYGNGLGQLQVFVNGHLVVDIPAGLNHLSGSGDYTPYTDRWVNFGPFDITSFVVKGQNNVTFTDLNPADHFGLVRNVMIVRGTTVLLNVGKTIGIYPGHSKTYTFSIPPLTTTSFTISPMAAASKQVLTFTATYTGGTAPFTCMFRFGDGQSVTVAGSSGTCTVTHEYNQPGTFMATVTVRGSSTSDIVRSSLSINVT